MRSETARRTRSLIHGAVAAIACTLLLPAAAQTPEQQIVNDAATALGGRDRVMAVKTMLLEGAGNFVGITSLRYDDDIGFKSAIEQLRDVKRAYDLANTRARFELDPHGRVCVLHRRRADANDSGTRRDCRVQHQPDQSERHAGVRQSGERPPARVSASPADTGARRARSRARNYRTAGPRAGSEWSTSPSAICRR